MDKPRIGVIGIGTMGRTFTRIVAESRRAELTGVVDIDGGKAKAIADEWHTTAYVDVEALLDGQPELDALIVATPDNDHVKPAVAGVEIPQVVC